MAEGLPKVVRARGSSVWEHTVNPARYGRTKKPETVRYSAIIEQNPRGAEVKTLMYNPTTGEFSEANVTALDPANGTFQASRIMTGSMDPDPNKSKMPANRLVGMEVVMGGSGSLSGSGILMPDNRPYGTPGDPIMPSKLKLGPYKYLGWTTEGRVIEKSGTGVSARKEKCLDLRKAEYRFDENGNPIDEISQADFVRLGDADKEKLSTGEVIVTKVREPRAAVQNRSGFSVEDVVLRKLYNRIGEPAYLDKDGNVYEPTVKWSALKDIKDSSGKKVGEEGFKWDEFLGDSRLGIAFGDLQQFKETSRALDETVEYIKNDPELMKYLADESPVNKDDIARLEKLSEYEDSVRNICRRLFEEFNPDFHATMKDENPPNAAGLYKPQQQSIEKMADSLMFFAGDMIRRDENRGAGDETDYLDPTVYFAEKKFKTGFFFRQKIDVSVNKDNYVFIGRDETARIQDWRNNPDSRNLTDEQRILLGALTQRGFDKPGFMHFNHVGRKIKFDENDPNKWFCEEEGALMAVGSAAYMDGNVVPAFYGSAIKNHFSYTVYDKKAGKFHVVPANYHRESMIGKNGIGIDGNPAPQRAYLNTNEYNDPRVGFRDGQAGDICFLADANGNDMYESALGFITYDEGAARRWPDGRRAKYLFGYGPNLADDGKTSRLFYDGITTKFIQDSGRTWVGKAVDWAASKLIEVDRDPKGRAVGAKSTRLAKVLGIDYGKIYKQVVEEENKTIAEQGGGEFSSKHLTVNSRMKPIDLIALIANYADIQGDGDELRIRAKGFEAWKQVIAKSENNIYQSSRVAKKEAVSGAYGLGTLAVGGLGVATLPLGIGLPVLAASIAGFAYFSARTADEERRYITEKEKISGIIISPQGAFDPQHPDEADARQVGTIDSIKADLRIKRGNFRNFYTLGTGFKIDHLVLRPLRGTAILTYLLLGAGTDKETSSVNARGIIGACAAAALYSIGGVGGAILGTAVALPVLGFMGLYMTGKIYGKKEAGHALLESSHGERVNIPLARREAGVALPIAIELGGHKKRPNADISATNKQVIKWMKKYAEVTGDESYHLGKS